MNAASTTAQCSTDCGHQSKSSYTQKNLKRLRTKYSLLFRVTIISVVILTYIIRNLVVDEEKPQIETNYHARSLLSFNAEFSASKNCVAPAINEFPTDGLSREQRRHGWILVHIVIAFYSFWALAVICDDYFVPVIDEICQNIRMQKDVVGATIMAAASASPELFMNCIGTFVTKGDIGVGSIVGSSVFNVLLVPACCGIFIRHKIKLDWWPLTRDSFMYCVAILGLLVTLYDGRIMWYEAFALVVAYVVYMFVMFHNDRMAMGARRLVSKYRRRWLGSIERPRPYREVKEFTPLLAKSVSDILERGDQQSVFGLAENDFADSPWNLDQRNLYEFISRWPITFVFWLTIPDCRKHPKLKYLTFLLSVVWIAVISYLVAFVVTILGDTLDIPDSVMGLTILAAGMSVPEAVSSIIVTKQGQGSMGLSNIIGSNTFDILLCLGLPWLVKACFLPAEAANKWVTLNSAGFTYSAVFLLASLFGLYVACAVNRFVLDWRIGVSCCLMYLSYLVVALLLELNIFFVVNLPICKH